MLVLCLLVAHRSVSKLWKQNYCLWLVHALVSIDSHALLQAVDYVLLELKLLSIENSISEFSKLTFVVKVGRRPFWQSVPPTNTDLLHQVFFPIVFALDFYLFLLYRNFNFSPFDLLFLDRFFLNPLFFLFDCSLLSLLVLLAAFRRFYIVIIIRSRFRFLGLAIYVVWYDKVIFLFGRGLVLVDLVRVLPPDFFNDPSKFDTVIRVFLEHHFGLLVLFFFFFLLFELLHLESFSLLSFFSFLLFSLLNLLLSLSFFLLFAFLLFRVKNKFVSGRGDEVLQHDYK